MARLDLNGKPECSMLQLDPYAGQNYRERARNGEERLGARLRCVETSSELQCVVASAKKLRPACEPLRGRLKLQNEARALPRVLDSNPTSYSVTDTRIVGGGIMSKRNLVIEEGSVGASGVAALA